MDLLGPRRHLLGVLLHELLDPSLIGRDHPAHLGADLAVPGLADLGVPHHALTQVLVELARPEDLRHGPAGPAVVLEQLLQPVLRLGIADGVGRILERRGEDVGDAELVAVNGRGSIIGRKPSRAGDRGRGNQDSGEASWVSHERGS